MALGLNVGTEAFVIPADPVVWQSMFEWVDGKLFMFQGNRSLDVTGLTAMFVNDAGAWSPMVGGDSSTSAIFQKSWVGETVLPKATAAPTEQAASFNPLWIILPILLIAILILKPWKWFGAVN